MTLLGKPIAMTAGCCLATASIAFGFSSFFVGPEEAKLDELTLQAANQDCEYSITPFGFDKVTCTQADGEQGGKAEVQLSIAESSFLEPSSSTLMTGEKSVIAGTGRFMSMAVAEMTDGSLAKDGTVLSFVTGDGERISVKTIGGIGHHVFSGPQQAGYVEVVAKWGDISTEANTVRVVPAEPVRVAVDTNIRKGRLTSDKQYWVRSQRLEDQYGNLLNDGSFVQFVGRDGNGDPLFFNSLAVNGIASSKFIERELENEIQLAAQYKDVIGSAEKFSLTQSELDNEFAVRLQQFNGAVNLSVGPLRFRTGAYVSDGLLIKLMLSDSRNVHARTYQGNATFRFSQDDLEKNANPKVRVGDREWTLDLKSRTATSNDGLESIDVRRLGDLS